MNVLARFLRLVWSLFVSPAARRTRPAFAVHRDFVQGQLSAGTIYRLMRDRNERLPA